MQIQKKNLKNLKIAGVAGHFKKFFEVNFLMFYWSQNKNLTTIQFLAMGAISLLLTKILKI
jgi:hypothetical protein